MSELVQMRQRIKAIETIKKVTHAMQLISMSLHTQLRTKKNALEHYKQALLSLSLPLEQLSLQSHVRLYPTDSTAPALAIIIGSQKGLCGNFNTILLKFVEQELKQYDRPVHLIVIGKKIIESINKSSHPIVFDNPNFTLTTTPSIARSITRHILHHPHPYSMVDVYYNYSRSFFAQKPQRMALIPWKNSMSEQKAKPEYFLEQNLQEILTTLVENSIQTTIQDTCLQSLIAEHAARFVAMDSSTRNASSLLDTMKLQYNKLRQAKITRELTDLISGL